MYKGSISYATPMLYASASSLVHDGGLTGLFLAALGVDVHVTTPISSSRTSTTIMVGGMVMATSAVLHFWWPKISGRMYPKPGASWRRSSSSWGST